MQSLIQIPPVSTKALWAGRIISTVPILLMLFGAVVKLVRTPSVIQGFAQYGYADHLIVPVGIIELVSTIVYLIPRTSVLGAILLTAVMGGAVTTNIRVGNPAFVMPIILGLFIWGGLYFRDQRLRDLLPLRT